MIDHLSASQIQTYLDCSLKYKFCYIDQLPKPFRPSGLALGSSIHTAVDWLHKKWGIGEKITLEEVWKIFEADWYAQSLGTIQYRNGELEDDVLNIGRNLLSVYLNEVPRDGVIKTEVSFQVPLVDFNTGNTIGIPLVGIIDKIEKGDVVADLKTWSRIASQDDLDSSIQLSAYAYAYRVMYHKDPLLRLDVLMKTRKPRFEQFFTTRNETDYTIFYKLCEEITQSIQKKNFLPSPSWKCQECEYRQNCWFWEGK